MGLTAQLEGRGDDRDSADDPPAKKMKIMTDGGFMVMEEDGKSESEDSKENVPKIKMRMIDSLPKGCDGSSDKNGDVPQVKKRMTDYFSKDSDGSSDKNGEVPKIKMRMIDSLPKGCDGSSDKNGDVPKIKMRMVDSLPKGCDGSSDKNGDPLDEGEARARTRTLDEGEKSKDENGEAVEEEKKEYTMITFNFRKANKWFKAIDLLKVDLTKDLRLKHYHPEGWHPPLPCPPRRQYAPTKEVIGETPKGDETWVEPMTFYPTMEEFSNLTKYIEYMESVGADRAGIARIVPPKEWIPRASGYNPADIEDIEIKPVQQDICVTQVDGAFKTISDRSRPEISVDSYRRLAISNKYVTPAHNSWEELEELYWKQNLDDKAAAPIYGADVCDTLTDPDVKAWNIKRLDSLLTEVMEEQIPGVNLPYLYFGMWKATFSWHVEDMDLHSVNYIHYGAPKTWYAIPPQFGYKLEQVAQKLFPDFAASCFNLLRHKAIMISPKLLEANGVRVQKVVHEAGTLVIVFPHAYHSGFNHGFNMAESTNFAVGRWVEYGKRFRDCVCRDHEEDVSINMAPFVKAVQPERFPAYEEGRDFALHPEDPWYVRRCLQDAIVRLERNEIDQKEFEQLKKDLRRKRQVPLWFRQRFILDYDDQRDEMNVDLSDWWFEGEENGEQADSPRVRQAKRELEERRREGRPDCKVRVKKLPGEMLVKYKEKMDEYNEMLREETSGLDEAKALILRREAAGGAGKGAATGVGFAGVDAAELLEQKAKVTCKAKKQHRFNACKKCKGCRETNCGECEYCADMPRFGGRGLLKQKCERRICVNPQLRTCDQCVWNL